MAFVALTIGFVSDLHFGPQAFHEGRLRKLTQHAGVLARDVVRRMNEELRPDLLVNLGDDIEDEDRDKDLARYGECQEILRSAKAELVNVAGNHDTMNLLRDDLNRFWKREGPLFYSLDRGGHHLIVLHTQEQRDVDIRIPRAQIEWCRGDLARTSLPTIVLMHHSAGEQDLEDSYWFRGRRHLALVHQRRELRAIFEESKKVRAVFNGHVHRNHIDVIRGIPYVSIQSLTENLDADAPGRPAASHAIATIDEGHLSIRVHGNEPSRYRVEW